MRENLRFFVEKYMLFDFGYTFLHSFQNAKTLAVSGFFDFFTKFSTGGGKLFQDVEKIFLICAKSAKKQIVFLFGAAEARAK